MLWHRSLGFVWSQVQSLVLLVFQVKGPYLPAFGARSSAVEHLTFNQVVVGSIPTGLTIKIKELSENIWVAMAVGKHGVSNGKGDAHTVSQDQPHQGWEGIRG